MTAKENKYLLVVICNVSKFTHAIPVRNLRAKTICDKLVEFFCFVGLPKVIRCDQMSSFRSELMTAVCEKFGINLKYSCAFHSVSHGGVERTHSTLEQMIRKYICENPKSWDTMIHFLLFALREAKHSSTQFSPSELLFGRKMTGALWLQKQTWEHKGFAKEYQKIPVTAYMNELTKILETTLATARANVGTAQKRMKRNYDKK